MVKDGVALGLGIAVGVVIAGATIYYVYNKKKKVEATKEKEASVKFAEKLKEANNNKKSSKELLNTQTFVELLTTKELTNWFREYRDEFESGTKMVITLPTKEMVIGLGYESDVEIDPEKNIIQLFYDDENKKVLKIRVVSFENIESNLQAHLIEEDGMLVITD